MTDLAPLIEAPQLTVDVGLELLDADDNLIEDISADLSPDGSDVTLNVYATIHRTCNLVVSRQLLWGQQRVRPYMTLRTALPDPTDVTYGSGTYGGADGYGYGLTAPIEERFNLGVFLMATPERAAAESPPTFTVGGFDKLCILATPHGATFRAYPAETVLDVVESLIVGAGETRINLDQSAAAETITTGRTWPLDEQTTTLGIINDLLSSIGYRALYVDRDGYYRAEPYVPSSSAGPMWTYDADSIYTTTVGEDRVFSGDYFDAPNRWVFITSDPAADLPVEGDGIYTVVNQSDGPTSIDQRGGRVITRVVKVDSVNQAALEASGNRIVEGDKHVVQIVTASVGPNPTHGHFDVVTYRDSALGIDSRFLVQEWSLPFNGGDMNVVLRLVGEAL